MKSISIYQMEISDISKKIELGVKLSENESEILIKSLLGNNEKNIKLSDYNYKKVYSYKIDTKKQDEELLEDIFMEFNCHHPKDYTGVSLSVSDIVNINNIYYLCKVIGWSEINIIKE